MDYSSKYLKYKHKYTELKKIIDGGAKSVIDPLLTEILKYKDVKSQEALIITLKKNHVEFEKLLKLIHDTNITALQDIVNTYGNNKTIKMLPIINQTILIINKLLATQIGSNGKIFKETQTINTLTCMYKNITINRPLDICVDNDILRIAKNNFDILSTLLNSKFKDLSHHK